MTERDYEKEAKLIIQTIIGDWIRLSTATSDVADQLLSSPDKMDNIEEIETSLPPIQGFKMIPLEQFPPLQRLFQGTEILKQKYGKELFILFIDASYCTKNGDSIEMFWPEHQWSDKTKKIFESLIKEVVELLKQNKLKPLSE